jgi:hypothetical protein
MGFFEHKANKKELGKAMDVAMIHHLLGEFFKAEPEKVGLWLTTPNPAFGNIIPQDLIDRDRGHKVLQFILAARAGY